MIELSAQQQLALLFPKSNRAVSEVLEKASPQQLQTFTEAKDIKSLLSGLMNDTLDLSKSNKIILDILKNSTFFKELGNFSKDVKTLIELLNRDNSQSKTVKSLQSILLDFSENDSSKLKDSVKNSGLFLESKLSQEINPKHELKTSLHALQNQLQKSELPQGKDLLKSIEALLQNTKIFGKNTDSSTLKNINSEVGKILIQLKDIQKLADPIHSQDVQKHVSTLEKFTQNTQIKNFSLVQITKLVDDLASELRVSGNKETHKLVSSLESIEKKLKEIQQGNPTQDLIKSALKELEVLEIKNISRLELDSSIDKLKQISQMRAQELESLNPKELEAFFSKLSDSLGASKTNTLFDTLQKILNSLKQPLLDFEQKNVPHDIKNWLNSFDKEVHKGDVVYSKSMKDLLHKIELFAKPAHLLNNSLLQESLQKDMKALLLGLEKELAGSSGSTEILKATDKLLVQIDYFQLLSHLSHTSCLYVPYAWEQLENGQLSVKKSKDGSTYCEIDLELSEYGKLNMMMQLFEDNQLNIMIYTQKKELKTLFKENIKALRSALVSVNVMPRNIHFHDLNEDNNKTNPYQENVPLNELGFETKG